jgi:small subunit ribosomal protein S1
VHKGVVRNLTQFGAFVELEEGIDGLVHISDLSWTKKVRHPSEIVKKNDEIEVVVLGINREERRIALGHKQIESNPWDSFEQNYSIDTETSGKVSRIIDKGVIITLPLGVDGFIPNQHLGLAKGKKVTEAYTEGTEVPAKVIEFDKENKKIVLSVNAYFKDKERKDYEDYLTRQGASKTTVEDVIKTEETPAKAGKIPVQAEEVTPQTEVIAEKTEEPVAETIVKTDDEAEVKTDKKSVKKSAPKDAKVEKTEKKTVEKTSKKTVKKESVKKTASKKASEPAAEKKKKKSE